MATSYPSDPTKDSVTSGDLKCNVAQLVFNGHFFPHGIAF